MKIETQLQFTKYLNLQYLLTYRKLGQIFVTLLYVFVIIYSIVIIREAGVQPDLLGIMLFFVVVIISKPILLYFGAKKNFYTHKTLQEPITYEFLPDKMITTTANGYTEYEWNKLYKAVEYKNWFLIYQSNRLANFIPKSDFTEEQIEELRYILKNTKGLKIKLKSK